MDIDTIIQIAIAIGIVLGFRILSSAVAILIIKMFTLKKQRKKAIKKNPFYLPLKTIFTFIGIYIALSRVKDIITFSSQAERMMEKILKISMILFVAKAFSEGLNEKNVIFSKIRDKSSKEIDKVTMNTILRTVRIGVYILAGFMIISEFGYNISGLITGLGISGVVITLAAQDTAKSMIGGISIFLDRPFKVGDYIKVGEYEGSVQEIRFRSTSIRTLDRSILHVPNSKMAETAIIKDSEIEKRRYYMKFTIELDTPIEKVEKVRKKIEDMLKSREDIIQDNSQIIRIQEISDNGYELAVQVYMNVVAYMEYLKHKEEINYAIMSIFEKEKVQLAYNTQTIYVKNN